MFKFFTKFIMSTSSSTAIDHTNGAGLEATFTSEHTSTTIRLVDQQRYKFSEANEIPESMANNLQKARTLPIVKGGRPLKLIPKFQDFP